MIHHIYSHGPIMVHQMSWLTWDGVQAAWNLIMPILTGPWPYNPFNP